MSYRRFSVHRNERKRLRLRLLAAALKPYRSIGSYRYSFCVERYLNLLEETERIDPMQLKALQLLRLEKVLYAAQTTPWWRERLKTAGLDHHPVRTLEELRCLSPVTKSSFTNVPLEHYLTRLQPGSARLMLFRTSGTTGAPFAWGGDKNTVFVESSSYFQRIMRWYGIATLQPGHGNMIASFTGPTTAQPSVPFNWSPVEENADASFRFMCARMRQMRLRVLYIYPTNLLLFAKKLAETGEQVPFELVIAGGQRLDDDSRAFAQKTLGCPIVCTYGCSEMGQLAIECPQERHRYHVQAERLLLEILDDAGNPVPDGHEGRITLTSLENFVMPLIRYQSGDRGILRTDQCSCGRTLPSLSFEGKEMDFLFFPSGRLAPFRQINRFLLSQFFDEIEFYQIEQSTKDEVVVRAKLKISDTTNFEERFSATFYEHLGNELKLRFEYPDAALWQEHSGRKLRLFVPLKR